MATVDLRSAYRSVRTHPTSWSMTGLHQTFSGDSSPTYTSGTRLPFGARKSSAIFNRLTQAVRQALQQQGFSPLVVYAEDILIIAPLLRNAKLH